jgi:hypothetical protein
MSKTWEDYYNDPEIVNESSAMREIHAIRLKLYDERQGLSAAEYSVLANKNAEVFLINKELVDSSRFVRARNSTCRPAFFPSY